MRAEDDLVEPGARRAPLAEVGKVRARFRRLATDGGPVGGLGLELGVEGIEDLDGPPRQDRREDRADSVPRLAEELRHLERRIAILGVERPLLGLVGLEHVEGLSEQDHAFDLVDVWRMHRARE